MKHSFGGLRAVDGVSFTVGEGMIKAVIGPNGAGKTTLFNLISGTLPADSGEAYLRGAPIHGLAPFKIARHGVSRTFQNIRLFPGMTVLETVMVGRHVRSRAGFVPAMLRLPWTRREEREIRERAMAILAMMEMEDLADREAVSLPFGTQRVVEFARALATEPSLLLLDEPAAGLNIYETAKISGLITRIREGGVTVLVIEHDMSLVMDICDEILVLASGKAIAEGAPAEIQRNPEVIRVYLGDDDA